MARVPALKGKSGCVVLVKRMGYVKDACLILSLYALLLPLSVFIHEIGHYLVAWLFAANPALHLTSVTHSPVFGFQRWAISVAGGLFAALIFVIVFFSLRKHIYKTKNKPAFCYIFFMIISIQFFYGLNEPALVVAGESLWGYLVILPFILVGAGVAFWWAFKDEGWFRGDEQTR